MKITRPFLCLLLTIAAALAFTGCTQIDKALYHAGPPRVVGTNAVTTPAFTDNNGVTHPASTNFFPVTVPGPLEPNTAIQSGINLVGALPVPFAGSAAALLGLLYSSYAAIRNKKATVAVVQGVDAFRVWLNGTPEGQKIDGKLLDYLKSHQEAAGVLNAVSQIVNEHTGDTVKPTT